MCFNFPILFICNMQPFLQKNEPVFLRSIQGQFSVLTSDELGVCGVYYILLVTTSLIYLFAQDVNISPFFCSKIKHSMPLSLPPHHHHQASFLVKFVNVNERQLFLAIFVRIIGTAR